MQRLLILTLNRLITCFAIILVALSIVFEVLVTAFTDIDTPLNVYLYIHAAQYMLTGQTGGVISLSALPPGLQSTALFLLNTKVVYIAPFFSWMLFCLTNRFLDADRYVPSDDSEIILEETTKDEESVTNFTLAVAKEGVFMPNVKNTEFEIQPLHK